MSNKERPILFSAPMVRAILAGTKTQTRRVITSHKKAAPYFVIYADRDGGNHRPVYSDDWERGFIDSIGRQLAQGRALSEKQAERLDAIWERVT